MRWLIIAIVCSSGLGCDSKQEVPPEPELAATVQTPQRLRLDGVVVQGLTGSVLWIEDRDGRRVPVVPKDPAMLIGIRPTQRVDIDGELRPTAGSELAALPLSHPEQAALATVPTYIHAVRITTAGAARPSS